MELIRLKDRIATILPDERNPMSWTWAELLSALFIVVAVVVFGAAYIAARLF